MNEYCNDLNNFSAQKMLNYLSGVSLSVTGPRWFRRVHWAGHGVSMAFEILTDDSNLVMSEMELH